MAKRKLAGKSMGARILIVDDAAFMRMMLADILTAKGHEIVGEAGDGEEALRLYKELKPDLVTMDIVMPEKDGIDAVSEIIKVDPEANIVVISAVGQERLIEKAIRSGARGFIVKPFNPTQVVKEVNRILG